jgi:hypothetical protein
MKRSPTGHDTTGIPFVFGEEMRDPGVRGIEDFREVTVGKEPALLVSLPAQAYGFMEESFLTVCPLDTVLDVSRDAEVEGDRNEVGIYDSLMSFGWAIGGDRHPKHLAMGDGFPEFFMVFDDLENHRGTQLTNTWSTDTREFFVDAMGEDVVQGLVAEWSVLFADVIRLATHCHLRCAPDFFPHQWCRGAAVRQGGRSYSDRVHTRESERDNCR